MKTPVNKTAGLVKKIQYLVFFGVFFLLLILCIRTESTVDFGLHIKAGEKIILEKQRIYQDPFTFTVPSHKYIDTAWLFQVIVYSIWQKTGMLGITLFRCLLVLAAFWVLFKTCCLFRHNLSIALPLILITAFICESRFYARPELFSFLFINAVLYILYQYKRGNKKFLWLLVIIHWLWVNIQGSFIYGWLIVFCFLAGDLIEKKKLAKDILIYLALSILVCFLNPYTYKGVIYPFTLLKSLREAVYLTAITEVLPPFSGPIESWLTFSSPIFLYACLIGISLIGILLNFRKQSFFNIFIYILFLIISLSAKRNIPLFCFVAVPMTVWNFTQAGAGLPQFRPLKIFELFALIGILLFVTVTICEVFSNYYYVKERRKEDFGIGISRTLPVGAVEFVKAQKLKGNVFNHFNFGGYLIWQLYPKQKVFIDGRTEVMGGEFFSYYLKSMDTQSSWEECANRYRINWVITRCEETNFLQMLHKNPSWVAVYLDETAVIFVKNTAENNEVLKNKILFEENYQIPAGLKDKAFQAVELYKLSMNPVKRFLSHLFRAQRFSAGYIHRGNVFASLGYFNQAEELYLKALLENPEYYEGLFNLGVIYFFRGQYQEAIECFSKTLEINPRYKAAQEWLANCGV